MYLGIDISTHDMTIPPQAALNYILNFRNNTHPITKNISRHPIIWPGLAIFVLIRYRHFFRSYVSSLLNPYRLKSFFTYSYHDFFGRPNFHNLMYLGIDISTHDMTIPPQAALNYILNFRNNTHPITKNISRHPIIWPGLAIFVLIRYRHFFRSYVSSLLNPYRLKSFFTYSYHDFFGRPNFHNLMYLGIDISTHDMTIPPQAALNYILNFRNNTHPITKNISRHPINQSHPTRHPDHTTLHPTQPRLIRNSKFSRFTTVQQHWSNTTLINFPPLLQR